jgi:hypothetical protein
MPNVLSIIIILFIVANIAIAIYYYTNQAPLPKDKLLGNVTKPVAKNVTNQTMVTIMANELCLNATTRYVESLSNVTNITLKESKYFDKRTNAINYLVRNWSNNFYDINGSENDISNNASISVFELITNRQRNFTIPIVCNDKGVIGNYSSCLLGNVPNIPSACSNLTINLTDCEQEWSGNHFAMDDIDYWISPPGGSVVISSYGINKTTIRFNFTINSTRRRLESFGLDIVQRTFNPMNDDQIFSQTKLTPDGKGGTIYKDVNLTNVKGTEFYATVWFKKKCYDKQTIY